MMHGKSVSHVDVYPFSPRDPPVFVARDSMQFSGAGECASRALGSEALLK